MIWGGAEAVVLVLGSGCKYRWSLAETWLHRDHINQLLEDAYQNPISECQVKTSSRLPLILHFGELYNYFIIYYNVIVLEIKCTINVMCLNIPKPPPTPACPPPPAACPSPWKNCLPRNWSLVPKRLGTTGIKYFVGKYFETVDISMSNFLFIPLNICGLRESYFTQWVIIHFYHYLFVCSTHPWLVSGDPVKLSFVFFWHIPVLLWALPYFLAQGVLAFFGLNYVSPEFICWSPGSHCVGIWRWGLGEIINFKWGHEGGVLMMGLVALW